MTHPARPQTSAPGSDRSAPIVVIGAGPAGLTAAYELTRRAHAPLVFEQSDHVGGLARTATFKNFKFDIGGHRFFTKVRAVEDLWRELLGHDLLTRPRLSRIYYRGKYFDYPLSPANALRSLGAAESVRIGASFLWARLFPVRPEVSFKDWVSNRFGRRLFRLFFESYTEKVWGIPCDQIGAQWAAQRIKDLSLGAAVRNMWRGSSVQRRHPLSRSLITEFLYPRLGPGMMWEACRDRVVAGGGDVRLGHRLVTLGHDRGRVRDVVVEHEGTRVRHAAAHVISTMPIRELMAAFDPAPPSAVAAAARRLQYRDFLTVGLIIDQPVVFRDNWLYVQDPSFTVGRIQNYKNWSPDMVPDQSMTGLGMEYFCSEGDALWASRDDDILALAKTELDRLGLVPPDKVLDGTVIRVSKAYPVYDDTYADALSVVRRFVDGIANLQLVGRNGMHKYNNQDHSMLTAMLAVRNLCGEHHDLWGVNTDERHHETVTPADDVNDADLSRQVPALSHTQPLAPVRLPDP